ncbi:MAG: rhomboid family intramembrane serine protease [candidate division SR1 bacterium]|nr:rhomboid family intramembrane serine protease [candidate division SR1 bacterium]
MDPILILIIINSIVYVLPYIIPFGGMYDSFTNFQLLGIMNKSDVRDGEWYRLFTSNFLHADVFHIFVNMYSLYTVGPSVLNIFKPAGFAIIYILSGIVGSFFSFLFNSGLSRGSLGASGAIMGLLGALFAYTILIPGNSAAFNMILVNVAVIALYGFLIPQIDNWGHLGGFLCGLVVGAGLLYLRGVA